MVGPRPRGRTGPHAEARAPPAPASGETTALAMLMTALLPVISGFSNHNSRKRAYSGSSPPSTPKRIRIAVPSTDSPLPEPELELRACLRDFAELEGIDWTPFEMELRMEDYTPDVIPFVSDIELRRVTGASNGAVLKAKRFCKEWYNRLEKRRRSLA